MNKLKSSANLFIFFSSEEPSSLEVKEPPRQSYGLWREQDWRPGASLPGELD